MPKLMLVEIDEPGEAIPIIGPAPREETSGRTGAAGPQFVGESLNQPGFHRAAATGGRSNGALADKPPSGPQRNGRITG